MKNALKEKYQVNVKATSEMQKLIIRELKAKGKSIAYKGVTSHEISLKVKKLK